jgi:hypothetical protein
VLTEKRIRPAGNGTDSENTGGRLDSDSSLTIDLKLRLGLDQLAVSLDDHDEDVHPRCRRCSHVLTAPKSVAAELGLVCRRAERGEGS